MKRQKLLVDSKPTQYNVISSGTWFRIFFNIFKCMHLISIQDSLTLIKQFSRFPWNPESNVLRWHVYSISFGKIAESKESKMISILCIERCIQGLYRHVWMFTDEYIHVISKFTTTYEQTRKYFLKDFNIPWNVSFKLNVIFEAYASEFPWKWFIKAISWDVVIFNPISMQLFYFLMRSKAFIK